MHAILKTKTKKSLIGTLIGACNPDSRLEVDFPEFLQLITQKIGIRMVRGIMLDLHRAEGMVPTKDHKGAATTSFLAMARAFPPQLYTTPHALCAVPCFVTMHPMLTDGSVFGVPD